MSNPDCPFCQPDANRIVDVDELTLILRDAFPVSPEHLLITTKRHVASWFELSGEEKQALWKRIDQAKEIIESNTRPDGYNIGINIGEAAGQTVMHVHVHVIPRFAGDVPDPRGGVRHVIPEKANYLSPKLPAAASGNRLLAGDRQPLLPHLLHCFDRAQSVDLAVAFILRSGVECIREHLIDLLERGGRARILTGDYLQITDPAALWQLHDLEGDRELRLYQTTHLAFHPKGYIFRLRDGSGMAFVGSSNLSRPALDGSVEWNYQLLESSDAGFASVVEAFETLFKDPQTRPVDEQWLKDYACRRRTTPLARADVVPEPEEEPPTPHSVQEEALAELSRTREEGNSAGLVVMATGLGKTWLSAFDSHSPAYRRILFVAHREEILSQALRTFRRIRPEALLGRYTGTAKQEEADILFASIQTLGRARHFQKFPRDWFDYVIIDEFHHAAARTYRRLIDYLQPKFLLGLTATPERTDGGDLLALCQENLVYRCDLFDGIERELLCPFHYFGVPDEVDYSNIPWRSSRFDEEELTKALATQKRAQNALEQHREKGGTRTLAFCCSRLHADFMAEYFVKNGLRAVAVHSGDTTAPRSTSLEQLNAAELEVVFAVDIFNEGVDLPNVDTILMLRPTESTILWTQQFGRGLRKAEGKTHLTVIDYIGNHRIFLTKPRSLFQLEAGDQHILKLLAAIQRGQEGLPGNCEVTYELEAVEILKSLVRGVRSSNLLEIYYQDFAERHGQRPTALEAFHDGYNPRTAKEGFGSWLGFVKSMGGLNTIQREALSEHSEFLASLETTQMTKSYKMIVLKAMLNLDSFPGRVAIDELVSECNRLLSRSGWLRKDAGKALESLEKLKSLLEKYPIDVWVKGKGTGKRSFFHYEKETFSTLFQEARPRQREAVQELTREIVDWRLAEYLDRASASEPSVNRFRCKVSHAGSHPILFLPDRAADPSVPYGWTLVEADGTEYEAKFVKIAVNQMRKKGEQSNILPELLKNWFGLDAGKPGTRQFVEFRQKGEKLELIPVRRRKS